MAFQFAGRVASPAAAPSGDLGDGTAIRIRKNPRDSCSCDPAESAHRPGYFLRAERDGLSCAEIARVAPAAFAFLGGYPIDPSCVQTYKAGFGACLGHWKGRLRTCLTAGLS